VTGPASVDGGDGGSVGVSVGSLVDSVGGVDGFSLGLGDVVALVGSVVESSGSGVPVVALADRLGDGVESSGR
jgi:hypothetical protein